jgi:outer membrane assembly lipoprotein YfiO
VFLASCGKKTKKPSEMSFQEHRVNVVTALKSREHDEAMTHLESMIARYPDHQHISQYRLALADLKLEEGKKHFDHEMLQGACDLYRKFRKMNPSDARAEYASYRAILAVFYQTNRIDQDSTKFEQAIKKCKKHLSRDEFKGKRYEADVKDILYTCERKLIDKEVYVLETYLRDQKMQSAENRLDYLKTAYAHHADLQPRLKYLSCKIALAKKEDESAMGIVEELQEHFTDSEFTQLAQNAVNRHVNNNFFLF